MADITTKAGRALLGAIAYDIDPEMYIPGDYYEWHRVTIAAIEAEAVRAERARLAEAVRGLTVPTWAGQQFVYRIDVLALLEGEA